MNIFEKMLKATDEINRVAKNLKVGVGNSGYQAVGEADVLAAVKPVEPALPSLLCVHSDRGAGSAFYTKRQCLFYAITQ